ncbi:MAG: prepilin-type N-terminal cleavage/methylation domain-containing protein [Turicibacter sp.]|nr:prepilin-type N-terminal cleavage/methylation domain-containing protein [Turicibacter sp.]
MMRSERGFTLIEALISLVIVAMLSLISYPFIVDLYDYMQLNQAITTLQADLHRVRDVNMMPLQPGARMALHIHHNEGRYVLLMGGNVIAERTFPSRVSMPHGSAISEISFNARGNLGQGRTLRIESRAHTRDIVFSVGVGGFDVR